MPMLAHAVPMRAPHGSARSAPVSAGQVDAQAAHFGGQQEQEDAVVAVEVVNQPSAHRHIGGAVHPVVSGDATGPQCRKNSFFTLPSLHKLPASLLTTSTPCAYLTRVSAM